MKGKWTIRGDAKGVLQSVIHRRARNPKLNLIVAEIQLVLGPIFLDLVATHFWSEDNSECDMLSRMSEDNAVLPPMLVNVNPSIAQRKNWTFLSN
eukprot:222640-Karenia_brevis.AAC.1